ncbi:glycosyltransferase [Sporosarcina sp. BI001-red]|uniref:MGDG synthase family glycosyltransferase n=1 Tax=Sporosarcina sp. BI001-red TaxID=2282866 RepID=UPI001313FB1A|nr:glycosyltransferase [Sporosarcina sp. BI001-red]
MHATKDYNLLLLCGNLGDGHKQAAHAIAGSARENRSDIVTTVIDFAEWTHPHIHVIGSYFYTMWLEKLPSLYGYLFQKTRLDNSISSVLLKKIQIYTLGRLITLLNEVRPSVVVSTFPSAAAAMSMLKASGLVTIPTVTVITDHTDHSYWIHPHTDHYLVGSEYARYGLLRQGVSNHKITVTGIPIHSQFSLTYDRQLLREKHYLQQTITTVLIMGGGLGMISKSFIHMLQKDTRLDSIQFIVICGRNKKLKDKLSEQLKNQKHRFIVKGYIDYIHELMALSDMIITKPGGLTTSEAVALELPMILYKPLPGQEQDNASFLLHAEVALQAKDEKGLLQQLVNILHDPQVLSTLKMNAKKVRTKKAAYHALTRIMDTHRMFYSNTDKNTR